MTNNFVEQIKNRAQILDIIGKKVRLRRSGRDWVGLCPFHHEKTGSFRVSQDKGSYYCFGCGAHGDVITFVQETEHMTFTEATRYLANVYGVAIPSEEGKTQENPNKVVYQALDALKEFFRAKLKSTAGNAARVYLKSRNIADEFVEKFQLGFAPFGDEVVVAMKKKGFSEETLLRTGVFVASKFNKIFNRYEGRLIFPIFDPSSRCVGFGGRILDKFAKVAKYINSPETDIFSKSKLLYGYSIARRGKSHELILVEGYLDVVSLHQAGFDGAVAPLGTAISEYQINTCWRFCDAPTVCLDGDEAGLKASYRWAEKILTHLQPGKSFKFALLPQGTDPDMLATGGYRDMLQKTLQDAKPLSQWIWDGAFLLYPSETPEQKAGIVQEIKKKIETISDSTIKNLYLNEVKQKERELFNEYKSRAKKNSRKDLSAQTPEPIIPAQDKLEKILVVTLINHPYIVGKVMEDLVGLELKSLQLSELLQKVIECYDQYYEDKIIFSEKIKEMKSDVSEFENDIKLHANFIAPDSVDESAYSGWKKVLEQYSLIPAVQRDLQAASSSLEACFSKDNWERLKALKKEEILNRSRKMGETL